MWADKEKLKRSSLDAASSLDARSSLDDASSLDDMSSKSKDMYSSGKFAKKAGVTLRTIRYYDKLGLLSPSYKTASGSRFYSDADLAKLQQILIFKYLGFSLDEIRHMTLQSLDKSSIYESLKIQKKLVLERIDEMQAVSSAIDRVLESVEEKGGGSDIDSASGAAADKIEWNSLLELINMTSADRSLKSQYVNASNIMARINLHEFYSTNKEGWFPWVYRMCKIKPSMKILEVGCGNGALWSKNIDKIPAGLEITLSDISEGMLKDARESIKDVKFGPIFSFECLDAAHLPYADQSFDLVVANHCLFYCDDVSATIAELRRVLKAGGRLIASTYGRKHMKEIAKLVHDFNPKINLSKVALYERFGLDDGDELFADYFDKVTKLKYEDEIYLEDPAPLISYILSCHGNQNELILGHFHEFKTYVEKNVEGGFKISKDAGLIIGEVKKKKK